MVGAPVPRAMSSCVDPGGPLPDGVDVRGDARPSALTRAFALLTVRLVAAGSTGEVLAHVAASARQLLPAADAVSITMRVGDGTFHTPVSLDPVAYELDRIQYAAGQGPCVDAARMTGIGLAASSDLAGARAWPDFGAAATARGFVAAVSSALAPDPGGAAVGSLNLYARHALDAAAHDVALLLATHGALALAQAQALSYAELQHSRLFRATHPR